MKSAILITILLFIIGCDTIKQKDQTMTISVPTTLALVSTDVDDDTENLIRLSKFTSIGSYTTFIIKQDGTLWSAGQNNDGQLGVGDTVDRNVFTDTGMTNVRSVIASGRIRSIDAEATYAIKDDGTLWVTGSNNCGQLGLGDNVNRAEFKDTGLTNVRDVIPSANNFIYVIKDDGTIFVAGKNEAGQLGLGDLSDRNTFNQLEVTTVLKDVIIAGSTVFILKANGTLWAAGQNTQGQLGLGDNTNKSTFTDTGEVNVEMVATSGAASGVILTNGEVKTTGWNHYGQLGLGDTVDKNLFTEVSSITNAKDLQMVQDGSMLLKTDNALMGTGRNQHGQLGVGDTSDRTSFTATGATNVAKISMSDGSSYLINNTGALWSTGQNGFGQLGVGDNAARSSFTNTGETTVREIYSATYSSILVKEDNTIEGAGYNKHGEFGLGDEVHREEYTAPGVETTESITTVPVYYNDADVEYDGSIYTVTAKGPNPSKYYELAYSEPAMQMLPFDGKHYTVATAEGSMTYIIKGLIKFDTLALGRILADSVQIKFKNSLGVQVGDTIDKNIDGSRDETGNIADWYTTDVSYSDEVMEENSTVEIVISGPNIELGTIILGMSVDAGFTKLLLQNSYVDYSVVDENQFGNIDYVERAKVAVYDGQVDIFIASYDKADRLMTSLGAQLIILNGSDGKNSQPNGQNIFAATRKIGRLFNFKQKTKLNGKQMHQMATYTFTLKEIV